MNYEKDKNRLSLMTCMRCEVDVSSLMKCLTSISLLLSGQR